MTVCGADPRRQLSLWDNHTWPAAGGQPHLASFDLILVNSSGGKDSQTMLRLVHRLAVEQGAADRTVVVHADLGRVEWPGVRQLAEDQAHHYGLPFEAVQRHQGDLLAHIEARGMFPSAKARYCTSDHKRAQVYRLMTRLVRDLRLPRPARVLNCLGLRAEESHARARRVPLRFDQSASTQTTRHVWEWLPILHWSLEEVWADIATSGVPHHPAYDLGARRLSCCFCVLAARSDLVLAAQHQPELAAEYAAVEVRIGHRLRADLSMAQIVEEAQQGGPDGIR